MKTIERASYSKQDIESLLSATIDLQESKKKEYYDETSLSALVDKEEIYKYLPFFLAIRDFEAGGEYSSIVEDESLTAYLRFLIDGNDFIFTTHIENSYVKEQHHNFSEYEAFCRQ